MALAIVWRWMKRALGAVVPVIGSALPGGHLDEIAEHVVVPDLQRADAGLLGIARAAAPAMTRRDCVAQRPHLVELGDGAGAHEAAVAFQQRQFVGKRPVELVRSSSCGSAPIAPQRGRSSAGSAIAAEHGRDHARPLRKPARSAPRSRGPPRSSASRDSARGMSATRLQAWPHGLGRAGSSTEEGDRIEPGVDRRRVGQRRHQPLGEQPRAAAGHGAVDRLEQRAVAARPTACATARDWRASPGR